MVQAARALQRISQYAIARPSREVLFTVIDQQSKYKAKNVIDTVVYRFGDLTAAWMQAGLRAGGFGYAGRGDGWGWRFRRPGALSRWRWDGAMRPCAAALVRDPAMAPAE